MLLLLIFQRPYPPDPDHTLKYPLFYQPTIGDNQKTRKSRQQAKLPAPKPSLSSVILCTES